MGDGCLSGNQVVAGHQEIAPSANALRGVESVRQTLSDVDAQKRDMERGLSDRGQKVRW